MYCNSEYTNILHQLGKGRVMKKRTLFRSSIVLTLALLIIIGGNALALSQLSIYLPMVLNETTEPPMTSVERQPKKNPSARKNH